MWYKLSQMAKRLRSDINDRRARKGDNYDAEARERELMLRRIEDIRDKFGRAIIQEKKKANTGTAYSTKNIDKKSQEMYNNFLQLDEVRYMEDLPPLGVNFIKLGLNDVLYDPKRQTIYTPNTNAFTSFGEGIGTPPTDGNAIPTADDPESRAKNNYIQGKDGKMNGSKPSNGGGGVDKSGKSGIIKVRDIDIPKSKLVDYSLNPQKAPDKAKAFKSALGYSSDNYDILMESIKKNVVGKTLVHKVSNEYGDLYERVFKDTGPNGKSANICTGWIVKHGESKAIMTSVYVTKKKVTADV